MKIYCVFEILTLMQAGCCS